MRQLPEEKLQAICENYINGNITDTKNDIKKLNKLQLLQFVNRAKNYGLETHQAYTLAVISVQE